MDVELNMFMENVFAELFPFQMVAWMPHKSSSLLNIFRSIEYILAHIEDCVVQLKID